MSSGKLIAAPFVKLNGFFHNGNRVVHSMSFSFLFFFLFIFTAFSSRMRFIVCFIMKIACFRESRPSREHAIQEHNKLFCRPFFRFKSPPFRLAFLRAFSHFSPTHRFFFFSLFFFIFLPCLFVFFFPLPLEERYTSSFSQFLSSSWAGRHW